MKKIYLTLVLIGAIFMTSACKKKEDPNPNNPIDDNENELITTLKLILTDNATSTEYTFTFRDLDGAGGNAPTVDAIVLPPSSSFEGKLLLLDETKNPVDTISNEVEEEGAAHQLFYTVTNANLTPSYKAGDVDENNVPIGLIPLFTTGLGSTGTLRITLKHQPDLKPTSGNGDILLGETDIEVDFNVTIAD